MTGISVLKTLDKLDLLKADSKSSSSDSNSKASSSFDDYLKNYSSSSTTDSNSNKVNLNKNPNENKNEDKNDNQGNLKEALNSSSDKETVNKEVQSSKETHKNVEEKNTSDKDVDLKSLASMILKCYNGGSIDLNKLKNELKNLKISENFQKDIMQFVSKLQDSLKSKDINSYFKLLVLAKNDVASNLKGHDDLINTIVNVLKSKLNKETPISKTEVKVGNKDSITLGKAEISDSKTSVQNGKSEINAVQANGNVFKEDLKKNNKDNNSKEKGSYSKNESPYKGANKSSVSAESKETISKALKENSSEDKFLKSFVSDDKSTKDNQISKVTTFMNQFSKVNLNTEKIKVENPVINKATFVQDVVKSVKFMETNNIKELTVKINPKELGEVIIKLSMENNIMKANISTANKETYTLLHSSLNDMNNSLNNQDIKIQAFSVNIYDDTTYFSGQGDNQNKNQDEHKKGKGNKDTNNDVSIENTDEVNNVSTENGNINVLI